MKYVSMFFVFAALFPLHGICVSFVPQTTNLTIIRPSGLFSRENKITKSPALSWTGTKALSARIPNPKTKKKIAVEFVVRGGFIGIIGVGIWSAFDDCKERAESGEHTTGAKCAVGTIGTVIAIGAEGVNTIKLSYEIASRITTSTVEYAVNIVVGRFVGGNIGFMGPFFRPPGQPGIPLKRDIDHLFKRVEDHYTAKIGVRVRHIGFWDGSVHNNSQPQVLKREESSEGIIPVFGHNIYGQDVHFAFTGQTTDGHATYKGGFDMIVSADDDEGHADKLPDVSSNDFDYAWIYTQLMCILGLKDPRSVMGDKHPSQLDAIGFWWQMFDTEYRGTIALGAVAPFSADSPSIIQYLQPEYGLIMDTGCVDDFHFENSYPG